MANPVLGQPGDGIIRDPTDPPVIAQPPTAGFTWSAPDRYSQGWVFYHEPQERYPIDYLDPEGWILHFNASRSFAVGASIVEYRWQFASLSGDWTAGITTTSPVYPGRTELPNSELMEFLEEVKEQPIEERVEAFERGFYTDPEAIVRFPAQGAYEVRLTVVDSNGFSDTHTEEVHVTDHFVVSLGDSYASGQGNPEVDFEDLLDLEVEKRSPLAANDEFKETLRAELRAEFEASLDSAELPLPSDEAPFQGTFFARLDRLAHLVPRLAFLASSQGLWKDEACFRSGISGPSLAAAELELQDPESSVTYISFACSGGTTDDVLDQIENLRGHLEPSFIARPRFGGLTSRRSIDALLMSVGGNDLRFADLLALCGGFEKIIEDNNLLEDVLAVYDVAQNFFVRDDGNCNVSALADRAREILAEDLPEDYDKINQALREPGLDVEEIYITEYPETFFNSAIDDIVDQFYLDHLGKAGDILAGVPIDAPVLLAISAFLGGFDELVELGVSFFGDLFGGSPFDTCGLFSEVNKEESLFMTTLAKGLNSSVRAAALRNDWNHVSGIADEFRSHGYCADQSFFRSIFESFDLQGDPNGAVHPNFHGVLAVRAKLLRDIYIGPDLVPTRARVVFDEIVVEDHIEEEFEEFVSLKEKTGDLVQEVRSGGGLVVALNRFGTTITWDDIPAEPREMDGDFSLELDIYNGDVPPRLRHQTAPLVVSVSGGLAPVKLFTSRPSIPGEGLGEPGSSKPGTATKVRSVLSGRPIGVANSHPRSENFGQRAEPYTLVAEKPSPGSGRVRVQYRVFARKLSSEPEALLPGQDIGLPGPDPRESPFVILPSWLLEGPPTEGPPTVAEEVTPTAELNIVDFLAEKDAPHELRVTYRDQEALAVETIIENDEAIAVIGPDDGARNARFVGIDDPTDGSPREATYRLDPPEGGWTSEANGVYTVILAPDEVANTTGSFSNITELGKFEVAIGPTPTLAMRRVTGMTFRLRVSGRPARTAIIEVSSDLKAWKPVHTETMPPNGHFSFTVGESLQQPARTKFYRARLE